MTLIRIDPFRDLREWNTAFDRFFGDRYSQSVDREPAIHHWSPTGDVSETPTEVTFTVELPGFEKDEIDIALDKDVLTISGERTLEKGEKRDFHRVERWYGRFSRSFKLPTTVNNSKIDAALKNGVLTIHLPKIAEAKPRQIAVSVS